MDFFHFLGQLYSAFASTAISTATSHANPTSTHQTSSVINSSQQQLSTENGAMRQSNILNNNSNNSNNVVTSQHQLPHNLTSVSSVSNASNVLDSHAIFTSINLTATSTAINNSLTNSVSPTNSIVSVEKTNLFLLLFANTLLRLCYRTQRKRRPISKSIVNRCFVYIS